MKIRHLQIPNNILLAPMAGITDLPYRLIMKGFGAGLVFTEMVSANGLIRDGIRTRELLRSSAQERPLGVQLFGDDPEVLAQAATLVRDDGELIDINLGCPVKKVVRSGAGSALLREPDRVARIISAVRKVTDLPLTVKVRSGWDEPSINFVEIGRIAQNEGVDAITLHPRTRAQGFSGISDWSHIRDLKAALSIPVIGSGDIYTADDALRMLDETGCDGIMIGRGGYGNPWLIRDILETQQGLKPEPPSALQRLAVAEAHFDLSMEIFGERKTALDMRKHLCWYSKGISGASAFRAEVNLAQTTEQLKDALRAFFQGAAQAAPL